jgi:DNA-binding NarL/FixJ family response regulator
MSGGRSRVLVLTTFGLDEYVYAALRAGASGFLLTGGIRAVAAGDAVVAPALTRRLLRAFTPALPAPGARDCVQAVIIAYDRGLAGPHR